MIDFEVFGIIRVLMLTQPQGLTNYYEQDSFGMNKLFHKSLLTIYQLNSIYYFISNKQTIPVLEKRLLEKLKREILIS